MAIKTTWTEVNQIIKEEFQRLVEKKKIQARIQQINEELAHMEEEDSSLMDEDDNLEEVEAGGLEKLDSDTGLVPNVKYAAKFDKKGSHLLEDEEDGDGEEEEDEDLNLADEFAELGAAIEAKIMAALGKAEHEASETPEEEAEENDEDSEDEDFEEVEVEEDEDEDEGADETGAMEEMAGMEEYREVVPSGEHGVTTTHDTDQDGTEEGDKEGEMKTESLNESVSRKSDSKYLNVLSEGLDARRKNALESEIERMRRLARLGNND